MLASNADLRTAVLKHLATRPIANIIGRRGEDVYRLPFHDGVLSQLPPNAEFRDKQMLEIVWSLIAQELAYMDSINKAGYQGYWDIQLTKAGLAAAHDEEVNPDNPERYLQRLHHMVPAITDTVLQYATESLSSYNKRCYLASAVMLGVASEAAFLEMARSFGKWKPLSDGERKKISELIDEKKKSYLTKFVEFRKRLAPRKNLLPNDLSDGMALSLDAVLDLLRIYRNESGHPTGKQISREDAFINLQMFARYLQKLYDLKKEFDSDQATT